MYRTGADLDGLRNMSELTVTKHGTSKLKDGRTYLQDGDNIYYRDKDTDPYKQLDAAKNKPEYNAAAAAIAEQQAKSQPSKTAELKFGATTVNYEQWGNDGRFAHFEIPPGGNVGALGQGAYTWSNNQLFMDRVGEIKDKHQLDMARTIAGAGQKETLKSSSGPAGSQNMITDFGLQGTYSPPDTNGSVRFTIDGAQTTNVDGKPLPLGDSAGKVNYTVDKDGHVYRQVGSGSRQQIDTDAKFTNETEAARSVAGKIKTKDEDRTASPIVASGEFQHSWIHAGRGNHDGFFAQPLADGGVRILLTLDDAGAKAAANHNGKGQDVRAGLYSITLNADGSVKNEGYFSDWKGNRAGNTDFKNASEKWVTDYMAQEAEQHLYSGTRLNHNQLKIENIVTDHGVHASAASAGPKGSPKAGVSAMHLTS